MCVRTLCTSTSVELLSFSFFFSVAVVVAGVVRIFVLFVGKRDFFSRDVGVQQRCNGMLWYERAEG